MSFVDLLGEIFKVMSSDVELLDLLEVPDVSIKTIKQQMIENRYPNDLVVNNLCKLCYYELPTMNLGNMEVGYVQIDIYATKDKNLRDRRTRRIAKRLQELLDTDKREAQSLPQIVGGINLRYKTRIPDMYVDDKDWDKYGLMFEYDYII